MAQRTDPAVKWVDVTPNLAEEWLGKNSGNRNKRSTRIAAYARDMTAGSWLVTGDTIKFDTNGRLVDAQHRLEAVIASGTTQRMLIVTGLDPAVQAVLDTNIKRAATDALRFNGVESNVAIIAAVARLDMAWQAGKLRRVSIGRTGSSIQDPTNSEVLAWTADNVDIIDAAQLAGRIYKTIAAAPSPLAFAILMTTRIDPEAALEFWESTAEMRTSGTGDPRNTLIKSLRRDAEIGRNSYQSVQISYFFRAWNAWRNGTRMRSLPIASGARDPKTNKPVGVIIPEPL